MRARPLPPRRATINDVATAAGVSRQTVTRAINGLPGINAETKVRVLDAAQRLRYRPSRFGRGLVNPEPRALGLVVQELANPYYPELASAVIGEAAKRGWNVVVAEMIHAADSRQLLSDLASQVDALLGYLPLGEPHDQLGDLPYVRIDADLGSPEAGVEFEFDAAMADLVNHLIERGARRPVLLDSSGRGSLSRRGHLFVELMRRQGIEPSVTQGNDHSMAAGASRTRDVLHDHPRLDSIMVFNDVVACGVLKALREAGVNVPGEVRVAGFDGLSLGTYVSPELTTLAVDVHDVATAAVGLAVSLLAGDPPRRRPRVTYRLLIRESS